MDKQQNGIWTQIIWVSEGEARVTRMERIAKDKTEMGFDLECILSLSIGSAMLSVDANWMSGIFQCSRPHARTHTHRHMQIKLKTFQIQLFKHLFVLKKPFLLINIDARCARVLFETKFNFQALIAQRMNL